MGTNFNGKRNRAKLQGNLRQRVKGGNYHYRLMITAGTRKEFTLGTSNYDEAVLKALELDSIWLAPTKEVAVAQMNALRGFASPDETVCEDLKDVYLKDDDEARSSIVRAAELGVINSSDILPVFHEFKKPSHEEFQEPTRWSLLNAFTETVKKYTPQRVDHSYLALNRAFGLDGRPGALFAD